MSELEEKDALAVYTPPFEYISGYIFDSDGAMVADDGNMEDAKVTLARIRGWGNLQYKDKAEDLQDLIGKTIAKALTEYWGKK